MLCAWCWALESACFWPVFRQRRRAVAVHPAAPTKVIWLESKGRTVEVTVNDISAETNLLSSLDDAGLRAIWSRSARFLMRSTSVRRKALRLLHPLTGNNGTWFILARPVCVEALRDHLGVSRLLTLPTGATHWVTWSRVEGAPLEATPLYREITKRYGRLRDQPASDYCCTALHECSSVTNARLAL